MTTISKIEQELLEATGVRYPSQDRQANLKALANAVDKLSDKDWRNLHTPAQHWSNAAYDACRDGSPIKDFPDRVVQPTKPNTKVAANGRSRPSSKPPASKPASRPASGRKTEGAPNTVVRLTYKNPKITREELLDKLKNKGLQCSPYTVSTTRSNAIAYARILREEYGNDLSALKRFLRSL